MVTKQHQLEFIAKNYESWPGIHPVLIMSDKVLGAHYGAPVPGCHFISSVEWQQERDKMSSKPEVDNSWYERGELPPVGCECLILNGEAVMIVSHGSLNGVAVAFYPNGVGGLYGASLAGSFRPLRTEREKAIEAACDAIDKNGVHDFERGVVEKLYDAGLLKVAK